ncbi:MAG: TetR/AcrR family transcriptional regulator C-terminal domain-containing protein [Corynebacterium sp.]|uniref:TetR/AcrR family transcriptional regulator C-terminal domain-containing protein n=1 Tax=Corynebacterium sp. TaxID=1720 RepID=UPI003F98CA57
MRKASTPASRTVGSRAGLTLPRIIEAARSLDADDLTMQALADHLGVDRKALNHHVSNRETLLSLVAMDAFSTSFSASENPSVGTWQDACRHYARNFTRSTVAAGMLVDRIRLSDLYVTKVLEPTETVLQLMVDAGFDDEGAMRTLSMLSNICLAYARDVALATRSDGAPRADILQAALEQRDGDDFPVLARISGLNATTYDEKQLDLNIEIFIAGAEAQLERTSSGT